MKQTIRIIIISLVAAFYAGVSTAETVTRKQASEIAATFFNAAYGMYVTEPKFAWNGRQLTTDRLFSPFYVYNHPKGGFVIISADNKAYPILAYSLTNQFSRERLGEEENELLKQYAHEIEIIRYDSREPSNAVAAWQNLPLYIDKTIRNPYNSPEFRNLTDERKDLIERIDRRNNWIVMPSAIEFSDLYQPENYRDYTLNDVLAEEEEIPFSFYENFIEETRKENETRAANLEEIISPTHPVLSILGGAHFSILFPYDVRMIRVYSMQGAKMLEKYYKGTNVANIDLSALPVGFYALLALGEDGKVYGVKVAR